MKNQLFVLGCVGPLYLVLMATALITADAVNLGGDKLIEVLEASGENEVRRQRVKTRDGSTLDETVVFDEKKLKMLIVSTKGQDEEQILYEDCKKEVEYIVIAQDPRTCFVHELTEGELIRLCLERRQIAYKKDSKKAKRMPKKEAILDSYAIGGEIASSEDSPPLCANKKLVRVIPEQAGVAGSKETSGADKRSRGSKLCCCNNYDTKSFCCGTCGGWWGRRNCCGGTCYKRVYKGRYCAHAYDCGSCN